MRNKHLNLYIWVPALSFVVLMLMPQIGVDYWVICLWPIDIVAEPIPNADNPTKHDGHWWVQSGWRVANIYFGAMVQQDGLLLIGELQDFPLRSKRLVWRPYLHH